MHALLAAVVQTGRGRDLVLFHSMLIDRTVSDRVVPGLATRRLTLVNLPGFGASAPGGLAIEHDAGRVGGLFPALGPLVEIPDYAHCPPLEAPQAFLAAIGGFLG